MLSLCGLQQRGYCHSVGYSRGDTATLWVTAKWIQPLSVCQKEDTVTLWVTAEEMQPLAVCLSERGYCHSLGYFILSILKKMIYSTVKTYNEIKNRNIKFVIDWLQPKFWEKSYLLKG